MGRAKFEIEYLEEAISFLRSLDGKVAAKIMYNVSKSKYAFDKELFKILGNTDIWEFRTLYNGIAYRLFAFWDVEKKALVVATHVFVKKTQKTPRKELDKAIAIRKQYYENKKGK